MAGQIVWLVLFAVQLIAALFVLVKLRNDGVAALCIVTAILVPVLWVMSDCAQSTMPEACVWGQALLPLFAGFTLLVGAPFLYLFVSAVLAARARRADRRL